VGGLPTSTVNGFAAHPTNPQTMYVAMRAGIFRSDNGGERWTRAANGPKNIAAVAIDPKTPAKVYVVTGDGRLFRSTDGGARWGETR
jgi:photosystem II stability/assembly factor-like uncharacterized protein